MCRQTGMASIGMLALSIILCASPGLNSRANAFCRLLGMTMRFAGLSLMSLLNSVAAQSALTLIVSNVKLGKLRLQYSMTLRSESLFERSNGRLFAGR